MIKRILHILLLACFGFIPCQSLYARVIDGNSSAVMLQGFHWESHAAPGWWNIVASRARDISASGFNMVWMPPSSVAASDEGYLPTKLYVQDSMYGTMGQLVHAVRSLHAAGVKVLGDTILNHRAGSSGWGDFTEPRWGPDAVCGDDEWKEAKGSPDTGKGYHAARDIDHTKIYVQESIKEWMSWLKHTIGYDGWRYDYVRGYSPKYAAMYNEASSPYFSVAEIWDDLNINNPNAHRQALCDWLDSVNGEIAVFDKAIS